MTEGLPTGPGLVTPASSYGYIPMQRDMIPAAKPVERIINDEDLSLTSAAQRLQQIEKMLGASLDQITDKNYLLGRVRNLFTEFYNRRKLLEYEFLDSYQRWLGQYSGQVLSRMHPNKSKIWVGITAMKCNTAHATIMDFLFGSPTEVPWGLAPPKIPDDLFIPEEWQQRGIGINEVRQEVRRRVRNLGIDIDNQMNEADAEEMLDACVLELVITGSMCIGGPETIEDSNPKWELNLNDALEGAPVEVPQTRYKPAVEHVPIINAFADMESPIVQNSRGFCREFYMTRRGLMELAMRPGFNPAAILQCLRESSNGNAEIQPHMIELRNITGDTSSSMNTQWRVIRFVGEVTGEELALSGADIPRELWGTATLGDVWFCGNQILKVKALGRKKIPYYIVPYTKRGGSMPYGKGVPQLAKSSQDTLNAATRQMLDNAAIASGPMFEVNFDLLDIAPGEDPADIYAWRVWTSHHSGESGKRAVTIHNIPHYADLFLKIIDKARRDMDEETFLPSLTGGMQGVGTTKTATGMSILNTNANKTLIKVMRYIDNLGIEPLIEALIDWNMRYNPNRQSMVLAKAVAKGASSLMAREIQSQRLLQLMGMAMGHPAHKDTNLLREIYRLLGFSADDFVLTDEEQEIAAQQQAAGMPQPGMVPGGGIPGAPGMGAGVPQSSIPGGDARGMGDPNVNGLGVGTAPNLNDVGKP